MVDDDALEGSEQFIWDEVSATSGVLTFDIAAHGTQADEIDTEDLLDKKAEQPPEIDLQPPPRKASALEELPLEVAAFEASRDLRPPRLPSARGETVVPRDTAELYEMLREPLLVELSCGACRTTFGRIDLGGVPGPMGLIAARHPYWCKYEDQLVSVVRLNPPGDRSMMRQHLGDGALGQSVRLDLAFEIADLAERPRCPSCGGDVRADGIPKAVAKVLDQVRAGATVGLTGVTCPLCRKADVTLTPVLVT